MNQLSDFSQSNIFKCLFRLSSLSSGIPLNKLRISVSPRFFSSNTLCFFKRLLSFKPSVYLYNVRLTCYHDDYTLRINHRARIVYHRQGQTLNPDRLQHHYRLY